MADAQFFMKKSTLKPQESLPELISVYLKNLIADTGGKNGPIGRQFIMDESQHAWSTEAKENDPLDEDEHEVAPGLVYKYRGTVTKDGSVPTYGRALFTITRYCASYCRYCTRGREVGLPVSKNRTSGSTLHQKPFLTEEDIHQTMEYLSHHPEINEVIVSGGDPLISPKAYLTNIIEKLTALQRKGKLDIIRVGTRLPIHNPLQIQDWHYDLLAKIRNPYLMVHINHPLELTETALKVLETFRRRSMATVMSQSVLLKGVNDDPQTLIDLFNKMAVNGIRPYYVFQCDPLPWAADFIVPPKRAIALWGKVRPRLSGVAATARLVIDVPHGYGKIPVPEGDAWNVDFRSYHDFKKTKHPFE